MAKRGKYLSRMRRKTGLGAKALAVVKAVTNKLSVPRRFANRAGGLSGFGNKHPFPMNYWTDFTYCESINISSAAGSNVVGTTYYLGLNCLYDVYLAAGGHQPYGFDQLISSSGPYLRYKVWKVTIEITAYDPTGDTGLNLAIAVHNPQSYQAGATISGLTVDAVDEKHNCCTKYISSTGGQRTVFKKTFPLYQLFNLTRSQYANDIDNTTGYHSGNPSSKTAIEIGAVDSRSSNPGTSVMIKGRLTFHTQCYDRLQLVQS